jgi:hypothetical protein
MIYDSLSNIFFSIKMSSQVILVFKIVCVWFQQLVLVKIQAIKQTIIKPTMNIGTLMIIGNLRIYIKKLVNHLGSSCIERYFSSGRIITLYLCKVTFTIEDKNRT